MLVTQPTRVVRWPSELCPAAPQRHCSSQQRVRPSRRGRAVLASAGTWSGGRYRDATRIRRDVVDVGRRPFPLRSLAAQTSRKTSEPAVWGTRASRSSWRGSPGDRRQRVPSRWPRRDLPRAHRFAHAQTPSACRHRQRRREICTNHPCAKQARRRPRRCTPAHVLPCIALGATRGQTVPTPQHSLHLRSEMGEHSTYDLPSAINPLQASALRANKRTVLER